MLRSLLLLSCFHLCTPVDAHELVAQAQWSDSGMPGVTTEFTFLAVQVIGGQDYQTVRTIETYLSEGVATVQFTGLDPDEYTAVFVRSRPVSHGGKTYVLRGKMYAIAPPGASGVSFNVEWLVY